MVGIWRGWLEHNTEADGLPPIVPVVIYNGRQPWGAPVEFSELFRDTPAAVLDALRPHLPSFRLLVDDLTLADDDAIEADHQLALAVVGLLALKYAHIHPDDAYVRLGRHVARARRLPRGQALLDTTMSYLYRNAKTPPDPAALSGRLDPEAMEYLMGFLNKWHEESREEGREEGREAGLAEGQAQTEIELLLDALANKFGEVPEAAAARIRAADSPDRRYWFSRIFVAESVEDIFAPTQGSRRR